MQANAHQTGRAHCDGALVYYDRHRPEQTTLYRLVQQHAASFIAHTEASTGSELPGFIKAKGLATDQARPARSSSTPS